MDGCNCTKLLQKSFYAAQGSVSAAWWRGNLNRSRGVVRGCVLQYNECSMCDSICVEVYVVGSRKSNDQTAQYRHVTHRRVKREEIWIVHVLIPHVYVDYV